MRSSFGVEEPQPRDENEQLLGTGERMLALLPGLTFDACGYRLGYGGGFYDTFLAKFDGISAGIIREAQFTDDLRTQGVIDTYDRAVQFVVTDERVITAS